VFVLLGGVKPLRGRLFDQTEGRAGADDRVLISEDLWRSLFGSADDIVGQRLIIDRVPLLIVGVLPAEFRFPGWNTEIWRAADFTDGSPNADWPAVYVRFASGMPRADALRLATDAARTADSRYATLRSVVRPLAGIVLDSYYERAVPVLAGGVVLVFLVLCANVSGLLLARLTARRREFAMRSALGASRRRLIRQALVESSLLGACGVAAGIAIGWVLVSLARTFLPEASLIGTLNPLNVDIRALAVTSVSGVVATFVAGILPAWIGTRVEAISSMGVFDRGGTETRAARALTRSLLIGEIALACTLLVGATLLVRSFVNLVRADRGLNTENVLTATVSLPGQDRASRGAAARVLEEGLRSLPGVQRVAWSYGLPPDGAIISSGRWQSDLPGASAIMMTVDHSYVGPEFFELYGISLLRGRSFAAGDTFQDVVLGERLAQTLWPGVDPIGRHFRFERERSFRVVGVVREIHHPALDAEVNRPEFYHLMAGVPNYAMLSIRCGGSCPNATVVRQRLATAMAGVRVDRVRLLDDVYFEDLARPRAAAALGFTFAVFAVHDAAGGLFSVLSNSECLRRREFGIRTALGASPGQIRSVVFRDGLAVALTGIAIGAAAAWSLARTLASLQYGVTMGDAGSWVAVLTALGVTTLAASWRPARVAAATDPVSLLRED
jgi:predicted permease